MTQNNSQDMNNDEKKKDGMDNHNNSSGSHADNDKKADGADQNVPKRHDSNNDDTENE